MSAEGIDQFEQQAAELIAVAKGLLKEFEGRIGEVIHAQRLAESETRAEGVRITRQLDELGRQAESMVDRHGQLIGQIERDWQLRIDQNAQRAGETQARAFGQNIAAGLEKRLAELTDQVETATRRLTWKITLRWALGLAIAIPLTIDLGIRAFMPRVEDLSIPGLTVAQTHEVLSRVTLCFPHQNDIRDTHVCVATDDPPRLTRGPHGEAVAVARGM